MHLGDLEVENHKACAVCVRRLPSLNPMVSKVSKVSKLDCLNAMRSLWDVRDQVGSFEGFKRILDLLTLCPYGPWFAKYLLFYSWLRNLTWLR